MTNDDLYVKNNRKIIVAVAVLLTASVIAGAVAAIGVQGRTYVNGCPKTRVPNRFITSKRLAVTRAITKLPQTTGRL